MKTKYWKIGKHEHEFQGGFGYCQKAFAFESAWRCAVEAWWMFFANSMDKDLDTI